MNESVAQSKAAPGAKRPRIGFLGVGWIGRRRMEALAKSETVEIAAIADPAPEMAEQAGGVAPGATLMKSLDDLLDAGLDGVVIATPSALHAEQSVAALERGISVFCQKPLGRTAVETLRVVDAARDADRLLAVDFSYRHTAGLHALRDLARAGELGRVYAANLVFHNAYGPDKDWFYDPRLSGGGCVIDLGVHLVDLLLWTMDFPRVVSVESRLFAQGEPLPRGAEKAEDYAAAQLYLDCGAVAQLACSWNLSAGRDAVIEVTFYGSRGGAAFRNVNGSFYEFTAERFHGTSRETLSAPPDDWEGRAAVEWARRLAAGGGYDPEVRRLVAVAAALDAIYMRRGENLEPGQDMPDWGVAAGPRA
jgi:predicted dehydrogenase